jgi:hypothetical protein
VNRRSSPAIGITPVTALRSTSARPSPLATSANASRNTWNVSRAQIKPAASAQGQSPYQAVAPPGDRYLGSAQDFVRVPDRAFGGEAGERGPEGRERLRITSGSLAGGIQDAILAQGVVEALAANDTIRRPGKRVGRSTDSVEWLTR